MQKKGDYILYLKSYSGLVKSSGIQEKKHNFNLCRHTYFRKTNYDISFLLAITTKNTGPVWSQLFRFTFVRYTLATDCLYQLQHLINRKRTVKDLLTEKSAR